MRLIKAKSNWFSSFKMNEIIYDCFKNPDRDEYNEIKETSKYKGLRGIIEKNGTVYIWSDGIVHDTAITKFGLPDGVHFVNKTNTLSLYITKEVDMEYLKDAFSNTSSLYNYFNKGTQILFINTVWYSAPEDPYYKKIKRISDILMYQPPEKSTEEVKEKELVTSEKVKRLIKKSINLNANIRKQINKQLQENFNKYFPSIPLTEVFEVLKNNNVVAVQEDGTPWSGFLCGDDGNASIELKFNDELIDNAMLILQWHKMESGRYEINTYVS